MADVYGIWKPSGEFLGTLIIESELGDSWTDIQRLVYNAVGEFFTTFEDVLKPDAQSEKAEARFYLEQRGETWVVVYPGGGVRPASDVEIGLWLHRLDYIESMEARVRELEQYRDEWAIERTRWEARRGQEARLREAATNALVPLGAIAVVHRTEPYTELSPSLIEKIDRSLTRLRAILSTSPDTETARCICGHLEIAHGSRSGCYHERCDCLSPDTETRGDECPTCGSDDPAIVCAKYPQRSAICPDPFHSSASETGGRS